MWWVRILTFGGPVFLFLTASPFKKFYLNEDWYSCQLVKSTHILFQTRLHPSLQIQPEHIYCVNNLIENVSIFLKKGNSVLPLLLTPPSIKREEILQ